MRGCFRTRLITIVLPSRQVYLLYKLLGGYRDRLETDYTVSVNEPREMADDAQQYIKDGFNLLKIKVGKDEIAKDIERIKAIPG